VHLPRRAAVTLTALALTGALAGCSDNPVATDPEVTEPGGVAPGGDEKNEPDDGEVEAPS
jgi:hypothetical protein